VQGEERVLIPGWLVEQCIRSAPSFITIYNRLGKPAMQLGGRNSYYGMGTDLLRTQDLYSGETRPSRLQDVINAARLADGCEQIDFIGSFALPGDVPTNLTYLASFKAELENSTKPIFFTAAGKEDLAYMIEMVAAVAGGEAALREKPFLIHYSEPTPPLTICKTYWLCCSKKASQLRFNREFAVGEGRGMKVGTSAGVWLGEGVTVGGAAVQAGSVGGWVAATGLQAGSAQSRVNRVRRIEKAFG
jgi:trimethylamine--corrinoid protein Co-methyltransferase